MAQDDPAPCHPRTCREVRHLNTTTHTNQTPQKENTIFQCLDAAYQSGRPYAVRVPTRIHTAYHHESRTPLSYRLPGEGDESALLAGYRMALMKTDPRAEGFCPLLQNRAHVLFPISPSPQSEYWHHQYDLVIDHGTRSLPVKVRQALSQTHPSLLLTKIIYADPENPAEDSAHVVLALYVPPRMGNGHVVDLVSTYPLEHTDIEAYRHVFSARLMFAEKEWKELTESEKRKVCRGSAQSPSVFVNDVTANLAGRRGTPFVLQDIDPNTGHCFAWMLMIANRLIYGAPRAFWRMPMHRRMRWYRTSLYPRLEPHKGLHAIEMWKQIREWIAQGLDRSLDCIDPLCAFAKWNPKFIQNTGCFL